MQLKNLMSKEHITQLDMAKILGVSRSAIYKYQQGKAEPNIETLIKIADYFDVSLDFLCGRPRPYDIPSATTEEQKQAINLILQLNAVNTVKATSYCAGLLASQS